MNNESILTSIKKLLGIPEDVTEFDMDIIMCINTVFASLNQMGIGPTVCYSIESKDNKWSEFIGTRKDMAPVKTYIWLKVRTLFDPPNNQVQTAVDNNIAELESRLHSLWNYYMPQDANFNVEEWTKGNSGATN